MIDGTTVWEQYIHYLEGPSDECGTTSPENTYEIDVTQSIHGTEFTVSASADLDQDAEDESFGIKDILVTVNSCPADVCLHNIIGVTSGTFTEPFVMFDDSYLMVPDDTVPTPHAGEGATLKFDIICGEDTDIMFEAEVKARDGGDNSFYWQYDDGEIYSWNVGLRNYWSFREMAKKRKK
eukprot:TRINITY_DN4335_c0_g1_i1.p1 TRINITY_DN4335_c0_g1~~TRINITY_DN4335_c0_g1_i1.p1  ORF type:complete len:205 (+),score=37.72 TRINITY_DN4335_c0_g1_i1:76-615(+)